MEKTETVAGASRLWASAFRVSAAAGTGGGDWLGAVLTVRPDDRTQWALGIGAH
jgi:hypothetical protein